MHPRDIAIWLQDHASLVCRVPVGLPYWAKVDLKGPVWKERENEEKKREEGKRKVGGESAGKRRGMGSERCPASGSKPGWGGSEPRLKS